MNSYDNEATEEMIGIYTTFQIEEVKSRLDEYPFEGDEHISPHLMVVIEGEIKTILLLRGLLDQLIES